MNPLLRRICYNSEIREIFLQMREFDIFGLNCLFDQRFNAIICGVVEQKLHVTMIGQ